MAAIVYAGLLFSALTVLGWSSDMFGSKVKADVVDHDARADLVAVVVELELDDLVLAEPVEGQRKPAGHLARCVEDIAFGVDDFTCTGTSTGSSRTPRSSRASSST